MGLYLPLSSSSPIFFGGAVRWLVDRVRRKDPAVAHLSEDELAADADRSPGVLMASGYIAGGAIAGILIALIAGVFEKTDAALTDWATAHNPFFDGPKADLYALLPFAVLIVLLWLVGREKWLAGKAAR